MLDQPHVKPLALYVEKLSRDGHGDAPMPDPLLAGTAARVLLLLEKPGPQAGGSGFISPNNDDPSADTTWHFLDQAGLKSDDIIIWNVMPWWDGQIAFTAQDRAKGLVQLSIFIDLLPKLHTVILVGRQAERARPVIEERGLRALVSAHPGPKVRARYPDRWNAIPDVWARANDIIER